MSRPFTQEVIRSLDFLRQAVSEVRETDNDLAETMTAIVDDLVVNLENQMMLLFANFNVRESEREAMLTQTGADLPLLQFYQQARASRDGADSAAVNGGGAAAAVSAQGVSSSALADLAQGKGVPAEVEALRAVSTSLYLIIEALAHNVKAEGAKLLLAHRGTGSLRVVTSVPDCAAAQKGRYIAMHQGLHGASFSCEVALRVDAVDAEMRKNYVSVTDDALQQETRSSLCCPVLDHLKGVGLGVIECFNKVQGLPWTASDEALAHHAAQLIEYILVSYDVELNAGYTFNPAALHTLRPYRPGYYPKGLEELPDAMAFTPKLLVARVKASKDVPLAVKGKGGHNLGGTGGVDFVDRVVDVKEMTTYIRMIDESHVRAMRDAVAARAREERLTEEVERLQARSRVLEENTAFLQEQLHDAKRAIVLGTFGDTSDANYDNYGTQQQQQQQQQQPQLPQTRANPSPALPPLPAASERSGGLAADGGTKAGARLHDFMIAASEALDQLRTSTLANSTATQRARLFSTPQPIRPLPAGRRSKPLLPMVPRAESTPLGR